MNINQVLGGACIGLSIFMAFALPNRDLDTLTCSHSEQVCKYQHLADRVNSFLENAEDPGFSEQVKEIHIFKWILIPIIAVFGISKIQSKKF